MMTVKELHELPLPLHEYLCGRGVDTSVSQTRSRKYFVYLWRPGGEEILWTECTGDEAQAKVMEVRRLIEAAKRVAT